MNQNKTSVMKDGTICYELWGHDEFSNEDYLCGTYLHYSSAWRAKKKCLIDNEPVQSDGLRDHYWIRRTTVEEHNESRRKRNEQIEAIHEKIRFSKEKISEIIDPLNRFIKTCTESPGIHEFPLSDSFKDTCIGKIFLEYKPDTKVKDKYILELLVIRSEKDKYMGTTEVIISMGDAETISEKVLKNDYSSLLTSLMHKVIEKHYFAKLEG